MEGSASTIHARALPRAPVMTSRASSALPTVVVAVLFLRTLHELHFPRPPPPLEYPTPPPGTDPLQFLWPEDPPAQAQTTRLELSFVPASGDKISRLRVNAKGYSRPVDGVRRLQVDDSDAFLLDAGQTARGERLTLELQGIGAGHHVARAWFEGPNGERSGEARLAFSIEGDDDSSVPLSQARPSQPPLPPSPPPQPQATPPSPEPARIQRQPWPLRPPVNDPPTALPSSATPPLPTHTPPPPSHEPAAATDAIVLEANFGNGELLLPLPAGTLTSISAHGPMAPLGAEVTLKVPRRVAMHAALLRWPTSTSTTEQSKGRRSGGELLTVFRLSDVPDASSGASSLPDCGGGDGDVCPQQWAHLLAHRTSSLHYATIKEMNTTGGHAQLAGVQGAFGSPRRLMLPSPPSVQLLRGPEDARLVELQGRACVLYNDVLPTAGGPPPRSPRDAPAARAAKWRMRRGLYLSCLDRAVKAATSPDSASPHGLRPTAPILVRASHAALRAAGAASDVEKNWVPFVYKGTLHLAYSLDPHLVLRVSTAMLTAAEARATEAAELHLGSPPEEVEAELVYATRFEHSDGEAAAGRTGIDGAAEASASSAASTRPQLRGGTPPVRIDKRRYLAIMHTVVRRGGKSRYAVAAYTFAARPPFAIEAVSRPFTLGVHATPYPVGLVSSSDGKHLLLSYGAADSSWHVARLSRRALLASLIPVRTEPMPHAFDPAEDDGHTGSTLPTRLHFARGAPESVREEVVAVLQGRDPPRPPVPPPRARGPRVIGYPYFL